MGETPSDPFGNGIGAGGGATEPSDAGKRQRCPPADRRIAPRVMADLEVALITIRGPLTGTILDLSLTGCSMLTPGLPDFAVNVRIAFPRHGLEIRAERRWLRGDKSGWRFLYSSDEQKRLGAVLTGAGNRGAERYHKPYSPRSD